MSLLNLFRSGPEEAHLSSQKLEEIAFEALGGLFGRVKKEYPFLTSVNMDYNFIHWHLIDIYGTHEQLDSKLSYYECWIGLRYSSEERSYRTLEEYRFVRVHTDREQPPVRWLNTGNLEELSREFAEKMGLEWRNDSHSGLVRYKAERKGPLFYPIDKAIASLEQNLWAYLNSASRH